MKAKTDMDYGQIKVSNEILLLLSYPKMNWETNQLKMILELVALTEQIQCLERCRVGFGNKTERHEIKTSQ